MRQTIIGEQLAFSDPKATHAVKSAELKGFSKYIGAPVKVKDYIWGGRITRFDFSGLSDLLITVHMNGGAILCFAASDVYVYPLELVFFVGDMRTDPWSVVGVFEVEAAAVKACTTGCHFVGPIELNKPFPDVTEWPNQYYPLQEEMQSAKDAEVVAGGDILTIKGNTLEMHDQKDNHVYNFDVLAMKGKECDIGYDKGTILQVRITEGKVEFEVQVHGSGGIEWYNESQVSLPISVMYEAFEADVAKAFTVPKELLGGRYEFKNAIGETVAETEGLPIEKV